MIKVCILVIVSLYFCIFADDNKDVTIELDSSVQEDTAQLIRLPEPVTANEAAYPVQIRRAGIEGVVRVRLLVSETGMVEKCTIIDSLHPVLDSSACNASYQLRFKPALTSSGPVAVELDYEYVFSLKKYIQNIQPVLCISGKLIEKGTRAAVSDATIVLRLLNPESDTTIPIPINQYLQHIASFGKQQYEDGSLITTSDSSGMFSFNSLPACSFQIAIYSNGHTPFTTDDKIQHDSVLDLKYYLTANDGSDYEIITYGKTEKNEIVSHTIKKSEVNGIAGVAGDMVKVVQTLPGVARPNFIDGDMCFRGSDSYDSEILLEGLEYFIPFHMGTYKSSYNSDAIESVEFLPGGFSVRYGNSVGGIMNLKGRSGRSDRLGGSIDCNMVDGTVFVEGPLSKKISFLSSIRTSYLHKIFDVVYKNIDLNLPYYLSPKYRDAILRLDVDPNKNNHLFFTAGAFKGGIDFIYPSARGGHTNVETASNALDGEWKWTMMIGGWDLKINDKLKNEFRINTIKEGDNFAGFGLYKWKDTEKGTNFNNELKWLMKDNVSTSLGITGAAYSWKGNVLVPDLYSNILSNYSPEQFKLFGGAIYLLSDITIGNKLTLTPGLRYDYWGIKNHHGSMIPEFWNYSFKNTTRFSGDPSFRMNVRYSLNDNHLLKAAIGNYSQYPQPWFANSEEFGNPDLTTTKASHYVAGYEWRILDYINVDFQVYYNRQWDKARATTLNEQNNGMSTFTDDGKAKIFGYELLLKCNRVKNFSGWLSYTLSKSQRFDYELNRYVLFEKDQTHNITAVTTWYLKHGVECGARLQYTTGNPATPVIGSKYDEINMQYQKIMGPKNSIRLPSSFQIHLRCEKQFTMRNWMLSTYLDVFNASYPLYQSPQDYVYNYDPYNYSTGMEDKTQINELIIPSLGIKAEF
jgi:TonB family protein